MRLIRNRTKDSRGKYAVILMQKLPDDPGRRADIDHALRLLEDNGMVEWGEPHSAGEFFVLMLKDRFSQAALRAYACAVLDVTDADEAYADDVLDLANRAGPNSPFCKKPD
jgi:hypothetical protein